MTHRQFSRRDFLNSMGTGAAAITLSAVANACAPRQDALLSPNGPAPDLELRIRSLPGEVQILDGPPTPVWRYEGELIRGNDDNLQVIPGSYLGPTIHARRGQRVRVHYVNELPQESIIHWHGMHVPENADGHPRLAVSEGGEYVYDFTIMDRAGTYWYHPHPHGNTGEQVLRGMAGLFIVHDDEEDALGLPKYEYDIPLVIQDRYFGKENQFKYYKKDVAVFGFMGDRYLVNGQPDFSLSVAARPYRLRLLNGSNARLYALRLSDEKPLSVIGTDGGLLDQPMEKGFVTLAAAQRRDIWLDFSAYSIGDEVTLVDFDPTEPDNQDKVKPVAVFMVDREESSDLILPQHLSAINPHSREDAVNRDQPKLFELSMGMGMKWLINNQTFDMMGTNSLEEVKLGDLEIWEFSNQTGHRMSAMQHPMHIHGLQFQVLERESSPDFHAENNAIHQGTVDAGWQDTVLVLPGEKVRVLLKFEDFEGLYMYHCHILEHEDMGMMRNYRVSA